MSNLPPPQQMVPCDTRFHGASYGFTVLWEQPTSQSPAPSIARLDISTFVSFGLSEGKSLEEKKKRKPRNIEALKENI